MNPMGWRFVVVADLGLASKDPVRVPSADGDAILAALKPAADVNGAKMEFSTEKAFEPAALGASPDAALHHPAFQRVESAFRGLKFLMGHVGPGIQVDVVSATQKDLVARFKEAVFDPEMKELRNPPLGLVILDYDFSHQGADLSTLSQVADLCKVAQAPMLAAASPGFFGLKELKLLPKLQDIPLRLHDGAHGAWVAFQKSDGARWTAMTVNRWVQRPPYTADKGGHAEALDPAKPESFLWGRGVWIAAAATARSIVQHGHALDASGPRSGGFAGMPTRPFFKTANQSVPMPTEVEIADTLSQELSRGAFIPISGKMSSDILMIPILVNTWRPTPGKLFVKGTLGYQMLAGRLAQLCAFLMDELPAGAEGLDFLKKQLTAFLGPLAGQTPDAAVKVEPVEAKDADGNVVRLAQITVKPDVRLESMEFDFVFQLPLR
ncbi:MAG TPA: type VI secretion system contractile sheath large subunit [Planctomycetota bacterium]|nr:type VI secretion system contractile sheath large subunit [Planctomycetota bacterium]